MGWIGVDLDGTLAEYHEWVGVSHIGKPIPKMVARVKKHLENGETVKILTARVSKNQDREKIVQAEYWIQKWCMEHLGEKLEVTCEKDFEMDILYDDRCVQIIKNTGERADGKED